MNVPWLSGRGRSRSAVQGRRFSGCLAVAVTLAVLPPPALAREQPLPSVAAEVRSAARGDLKTFYRTRNYRPLWVQGGMLSPAADGLLTLIESSDLDGLNPRDYDPEQLRRAIDEARGGSPKTLARVEVRLSQALADYVAGVRRPTQIEIKYLDRELMPERLEAPAVLNSAAAAPSLADYVESEGWMSPVYVRLRQGLADYREHWAALPAVEIPAGPTLHPGNRGERVSLLRARLGLGDGGAFDKPLAARLKAFQAAHGMPADGVAGARTVDALNREPDYYESLIRLNMERARALPSPYRRHILVDAASARLWLYEDGQVKDTMKVVVGKAATPTPMLVGMMRYAILNPYWNVPPDLVANKIAPKVLAGASLKAMRYEALSDWTQNARLLSPKEIDWRAVADGREELRLRQLPGPANAMGRVKFMFPNDLGIYLHDTPERELLAKPDRHFSNGCIRLDDAARLGEWLFGKPLEPPSDAPEQVVALPDPVPVYVTYLTAAPTDSGIAFRNDVYARDEAAEQRFASR